MSESILVVDDDIDVGHAIENLLRVSGMDVKYFEHPHEALNILRKRRFDIALVDLHMPHMNGLELAKIMMKHQPSLSIIIMTGDGTIDDYLAAQSSGVTDFIHKPFDTASFLRMMKEMRREGEGANPANQDKGHIQLFRKSPD